MKLKNLFPLAAALAFPLSIVSCGDEEKKEESGGTAPDAPAKKDHTQIGKEVGAIMDTLMEGMSSISDKKSAEEFVAGFGEQKASLAALLKAAKQLDPPTAEEKAAVQALKDASDAKGGAMMGKMMKMMTENADAEAIGEIMDSIMSDKEMAEVTDGLEALYDLKDGSEEPPEPVLVPLGVPLGVVPAPVPAPAVSAPAQPIYKPGQLVETAMHNSTFFSMIPQGNVKADKVLPAGTPLKFISNSGTFSKVELDSGAVGFVPSIMIIARSFDTDIVPPSNPYVPVPVPDC